ncbi:MAG TPA: hypothetical protein VG271_15985 [Beijerinckiaceae bacterium]|nr:hypothetical protein [Beijerinckiaceae bacterium]
MRRAHRIVHRWIWPALAIAIVIGFNLALVWRPPPDADDAGAAAADTTK